MYNTNIKTATLHNKVQLVNETNNNEQYMLQYFYTIVNVNK